MTSPTKKRKQPQALFTTEDFLDAIPVGTHNTDRAHIDLIDLLLNRVTVEHARAMLHFYGYLCLEDTTGYFDMASINKVLGEAILGHLDMSPAQQVAGEDSVILTKEQRVLIASGRITTAGIGYRSFKSSNMALAGFGMLYAQMHSMQWEEEMSHYSEALGDKACRKVLDLYPDLWGIIVGISGYPREAAVHTQDSFKWTCSQPVKKAKLTKPHVDWYDDARLQVLLEHVGRHKGPTRKLAVVPGSHTALRSMGVKMNGFMTGQTNEFSDVWGSSPHDHIRSATGLLLLMPGVVHAEMASPPPLKWIDGSLSRCTRLHFGVHDCTDTLATKEGRQYLRTLAHLRAAGWGASPWVPNPHKSTPHRQQMFCSKSTQFKRAIRMTPAAHEKMEKAVKAATSVMGRREIVNDPVAARYVLPPRLLKKMKDK